jgi:lysophospholipase L1-like esterase
MIVVGKSRQRHLTFFGNSLMNNGIPPNVYNSLIGSNSLTLDNHLCISGQTTTQLVGKLPQIHQTIEKGDVCIFWEGTNDMRLNSLTGAQAWTNTLQFILSVIPVGVRLIVGTVLARDQAGDPTALMDTYIPDYNNSIRTNTHHGYTVVDYAANPIFDARVDASNTTYYDPDKLHLNNTGYQVIIDTLTPAITAVL